MKFFVSFFKTNQIICIQHLHKIFRCTISTYIWPTTPRNKLIASETTKGKKATSGSLTLNESLIWSTKFLTIWHPHEQSRYGSEKMIPGWNFAPYTRKWRTKNKIVGVGDRRERHAYFSQDAWSLDKRGSTNDAWTKTKFCSKIWLRVLELL